MATYTHGGLNLGSLKCKNVALLGKWWWRLHNEPSSLWAKVIVSLYGPSGGLIQSQPPSNHNFSSSWLSIVNAGNSLGDLGIQFSSSFMKGVGNGTATRFWTELWIADGCLQQKYKRLYELDNNKEAMIADRVTWSETGCIFTWDWARDLRGRAHGELEDMQNLIRSFERDNRSDGEWFWSMATNGKFTTKKLNDIIAEKVLSDYESHPPTLRNNLVPKKVEIFIWRARKKKIPVLLELDKRGIDLHSVLCPVCNDDIETVEHALILCPFAFDVWSRVYKWWGLGNVSNLSTSEVFVGNVNKPTSHVGRKIWEAVEWTCGYILWKNRNNKVFKNKSWCVSSTLNEIQIISFDWISRRLKGVQLDWCVWLSNPQAYLEK